MVLNTALRDHLDSVDRCTYTYSVLNNIIVPQAMVDQIRSPQHSSPCGHPWDYFLRGWPDYGITIERRSFVVYSVLFEEYHLPASEVSGMARLTLLRYSL